jgi:hypothetical protein
MASRQFDNLPQIAGDRFSEAGRSLLPHNGRFA